MNLFQISEMITKEAKYIFFTSEDLVATPMGEMEDFGEICSFELPEMPGSGVTTFSNFYYTNSAKSGKKN